MPELSEKLVASFGYHRRAAERQERESENPFEGSPRAKRHRKVVGNGRGGEAARDLDGERSPAVGKQRR